MPDIKRYSIEQTTDFLANFLPEGKALLAKNVEGSNLRKYLTGSSQEFKRLNDTLATFLEDIDPSITVNFIEEWESALRIPDDCIPIAATDQERRENIVLKLTSLSVQTEADFIELAAKFGFTITTTSNKYPPYDVPFFPWSEYGAAFTWEISGDFSSDPAKAIIFECLVRLLIPANYGVLFVST